MNQSDDNQISPEELELARDRLRRNPHIREFLGKWIAPGFECSVLGQNILIDSLSDIGLEDHETERRVANLERILEKGRENCKGFRDIFKGNPPSGHHIANDRILGMLAEVGAFEWLRNSGFESIQKLPSTVDFLASRSGQKVGAEVTRLGIPQSDRKVVRPIDQGPTWNFYGHCQDPQKIEVSVYEAVEHKIRQLREFRRNYRDGKAIIIILTGRGLLPSSKGIREDVGLYPRAWREAVESVWNGRDENVGAVLDAIVLLDGKNVAVCPESFGSSGAR